jgi:hypothetical protein
MLFLYTSLLATQFYGSRHQEICIEPMVYSYCLLKPTRMRVRGFFEAQRMREGLTPIGRWKAGGPKVLKEPLGNRRTNLICTQTLGMPGTSDSGDE